MESHDESESNPNLDELKKAGLVPGELPPEYAELVKNMDSEQIACIVKFKRDLDEIREGSRQASLQGGGLHMVDYAAFILPP